MIEVPTTSLPQEEEKRVMRTDIFDRQWGRCIKELQHVVRVAFSCMRPGRVNARLRTWGSRSGCVGVYAHVLSLGIHNVWHGTHTLE